MNILPMSRKAAKAIQSKFYFTGKSCKHGHISKRYTSGACVQCCEKHCTDYHKNNRDKILLRKKTHRKNNRDKVLLQERIYYKNNRDKLLIRKSIYYKNNKIGIVKYQNKYIGNNKEKIAKSRKKYAVDNKDKVNYLNALHRIAKLNRTPQWLSYTDKELMKNMYLMAVRISKETGIKHHVDHIIPLQGELVSGLHVPWNLQILTATENLSKGNRVSLGIVL